MKNIIIVTRVVRILKHNNYYDILKFVVCKLLFDTEKHSVIGPSVICVQAKLHRICFILSALVGRKVNCNVI